jgi:hypothetical protein
MNSRLLKMVDSSTYMRHEIKEKSIKL